MQTKNSDARIEEYEFQDAHAEYGESMTTFETVDFIGIRIPLAQGAQQEAVRARARIDNGETFDQVLDSYMKINPE